MKILFRGTGRVVMCLLFVIAATFAQSRMPEELITQVLKAMEAKDQQALKAVVLSREEIKKLVWPAVAQNVSGNGMNAGKFSEMNVQTSDLGISSALSELGGRKWQLLRVALDAPQKQSKTYRVFPAPIVTIRDEAGQERSVRLVGGLLEQNGAYKVATYYVSPGKE